jgi:hypothetical protein
VTLQPTWKKFSQTYLNLHGHPDFCQKRKFLIIRQQYKTHWFCSYTKVCSTTILMLLQWQVPVTLDDTQQYLILNGIIITIKQKLGEKMLVNLTWNKNNWNLYSEQNNGIPHFLQQYEKQGIKLNSLDANNFHTLMEMKYIPYSSIKKLEILRLHVNLLHVPYLQSHWN